MSEVSMNALSDQVNNLAVLREEVKGLEAEIDNLLAYNAEFQKLNTELNAKKIQKELLQLDMIKQLQAARVKSWKTDMATISVAKRVSTHVADWYKKDVERRLKTGEKVDGFELRETEYISIRSAK